jgi:hypothetical protein
MPQHLLLSANVCDSPADTACSLSGRMTSTGSCSSRCNV